MDIMFNLDQVRLKVDKKINNISFRTTIKLKKDEYRIYEGFIFHFGKDIKTSINIGFGQPYSNDEIFCTIYGDFRGNFDFGVVRINYGTVGLGEYKVSTSVIRYFGKNFGIGISSGDEYIGPRVEYKLKIKGCSIRLHLSYTDKINYGVKINI